MSINYKNDKEYGKIDFVGKIGLFGGFSLVLFVIAIILIFTKGINYGIDFAGGTEVQVKFEKPVEMDKIRTFIDGLGVLNPGIQGFGEKNEFIIRFQVEAGKNDKETNQRLLESIAKVKEGINTKFIEEKPEIRKVDSVGPQVGAELKRHALLAAFYSLLAILIYVGLRFEYEFAPGAVLCLFHDAIITLGIFVLIGKEVNVQIMAAILTLIGYSLNDTIVVFDRIRETHNTFRDKGTPLIINRAVNDMLQRTILTSLLTFFSAASLYIFGTGVIQDLALAFGIGIIAGTYSSIYIAAPFIIFMEKLKLKPV